MGKINDFLMSFCAISIMIMVPFMTAIIFVQVVLRYVFSAPLRWPEEMSRYLLVWISCLGAAYAVRKGMHISVVFIRDRLPGTIKTLVAWASYFLMIGFFMFCFCCGVEESYSQWLQKTPSMRIPMTLPKLAIPVGFGIMVMFGLELLIEDVKKRYREKVSQNT